MNEIKKYKKIVSLDFELYNSMYYWSICWVGCYCINPRFKKITSFDIKVNPDIRHKFCGKEIIFPFSGEEIRKEQYFGAVAGKLLKELDSRTLILGHAIENDIRMLIDAVAKYDLPCPACDYVDTNTLYNALTGESGERALGKLAEKYGIEFNPHDPLEDARATALVAEKITDGDILGFMKKQNIEPCRLENFLMYKGMPPKTTGEFLDRRNKMNRPFLFGRDIKRAKELYYFDGGIVQKQDISAVLEVLRKNGHGFTSTAYSAKTVVSNNLLLGATPNTISLRGLVEELGLDSNKFDFTPKRIRDRHNQAITAGEYYLKKYASLVKSGILGGKKVSFTKRVERDSCFENFIKAVYNSGGRISYDVHESDIFIIAETAELTRQGDNRLRAYRRFKKQKVYTLEEFNDYLAEQN